MIDVEKAKEIARELDVILADKKGRIAAIEPESKQYFLGKNIIEAHKKASKSCPGKEFFFHRIGFKSAFFIGGAIWRHTISSACPS